METDFFDTMLAQCQERAARYRKLGIAPALATNLENMASLCQVAIANGRKRRDIATVASIVPDNNFKYESLTTAEKKSFSDDEKAALPKHPSETIVAGGK